MNEQLIWQVGKPWGFIWYKPTGYWAPEYDYFITNDNDPVNRPSIPRYMTLERSRLHWRNSTGKLRIHFALDEDYSSLTYVLPNTEGVIKRGIHTHVALDGVPIKNTVTDNIDLGSVPAGDHVLELSMSGTYTRNVQLRIMSLRGVPQAAAGIAGLDQAKQGGGLMEQDAPAGPPTGYSWRVNGTHHVVYRSEDGQIHEYRGGRTDNWNGWNHFNLTTEAGAPLAAGDPSGYVWESDRSQHIVYRGIDGHIHELWRRNGETDKWQYVNLTEQTGDAPLAAGDPMGLAVETDSTQHVFYRGANGHVHQLWGCMAKDWSGWTHADLTTEADAPLAVSDPKSYMWEGDASHHIVYRGPNGHVHEIWKRRIPGDHSAWSHVDLTAQAGGAPVAVGEPMGYAWEGDSTQHVVYRGPNGHVHELWGRMSGDWSGWVHVDLTDESLSAPVAESEPMGYAWEACSSQHVVYRGADGKVHKLSGSYATQGEWSGWEHIDLTAASDASDTFGTPMGYVWEDDATQHIVFHCNTGDIQEIWSRSDEVDWSFRLVT